MHKQRDSPHKRPAGFRTVHVQYCRSVGRKWAEVEDAAASVAKAQRDQVLAGQAVKQTQRIVCARANCRSRGGSDVLQFTSNKEDWPAEG